MRRREQRSVGSKLRRGVLWIYVVQFGEIGTPSPSGEYAVRLKYCCRLGNFVCDPFVCRQQRRALLFR